MIRYAISHRAYFAGDDHARQHQLVQQAVALAREGVDYFQLREKDLDEAALFALTCAVRDAVRVTATPMQIVLNGPRDICERAGVGWHRTGPFDADGPGELSCTSCSVHSIEEVAHQRTRAQLLLFAPVFGKTVEGQAVQPGAGLQLLRDAVQQAGGTPVLALGGVTVHNASLCTAAGAAGIAGIRLFLRGAQVPLS